MANEHNGKVPRDWWLEDWEKKAALDFFIRHPRDGYRRLAYMMIDADVMACAPSTVYRVLTDAGLPLRSTPCRRRKARASCSPKHRTRSGIST